MTKQPVNPPVVPLHTTAGLIAAKNNVATGENKIFIKAECRIKSSSKKDQKSTDYDSGQWGKPWSKEAFLSGLILYLLKISWLIINFECVLSIRGS